MSTFALPPESGSRAFVPPLAWSTARGKRYQRSPGVEAEIQKMLCLHESEWMAAAGDLQNETIVFLIRRIRRGDQEVYGRLFEELSSRIVRMAGRWAQGFDEITTEEIVWSVERQILDLVLTEEPSRKSEFLQVAFGFVVERRTINAVQKYHNSPWARRGQIPAVPDDEDNDEEIERPIEFAADEGLDPEGILLEKEDQARRREWIQKAYDAVEDPRQFQALILFCCHGWPITSKDPTKKDLARHFKATPRQIRYWIATALKTVRDAVRIGEPQ